MRIFLPLLCGLLGCSPLIAAPQKVAGEQADGSVLVTTNQIVTPLGKVHKTEGLRPKDLAVSPDGSLVAVLTTGKVLLFAPDGKVEATVSVNPGPLGLAWLPDGKVLYASGEDGKVHSIEKVRGTWKASTIQIVDPKDSKPFIPQDLSPESEAKRGPRKKNDPQMAGLAVSPDGQRLYAALGIANRVAVFDLAEGKRVGEVATGVAPYTVTLSPNGRTLYAANRGGRAPEKGEPTETSAGTRVRIDPATDAAAGGSFSIIDTEKLTATEIAAGRQPAGMVGSADGQTLYVAIRMKTP